MKDIFKFKSVIMYVISMALSYISYAQNTPISYGRCNGCTGATPAYDIVPYTISDVTSDYGMRVVRGSKFHQGIDYVPSGSTMGSGDAVVAIESGTIVSLDITNGLKRVVINGGPNGHIFAYLHLFDDFNVGANSTILPYRLGGFVLIRIPNTNGFAIIDIANVTAYSQSGFINRIVRYNNVNYTTTDQVTAGRAFAPIGMSGGVPYHLHVALLESGTADRSSTESIDPWNVISSQTNQLFTRFRTRQPTNFSGNVSDHNVGNDNWGQINIDYQNNGTTLLGRNVLEVEVSMPNAAVVPNTGNDQYSNVVMNEDKIEIQIKKDNENTFQNIIGSENYGFFHIDPKGQDPIFPSRIYNNYGGLKQKEAGIIPFAYRSGPDNISGQPGSYTSANNPHDYYFFPDFFPRILKNDIPGGKFKLSDTPSSARYNDGKYKIRSSVTNIHDIRFNSVAANFNLDNFMPFLSKITAKYSNNKFYEIHRIQLEGYDVQNDGYVSNFINDIGFTSGFIPYGTISIEIETTEPLQDMKMTHKKSTNSVFSHEIPMDSIGLNKYKAEFSAIGYGIEDTINVRFYGQDVSSNQLLNIYKSSIYNSIFKKVSIPTRKGNQVNDWINLPQNSGYDQIDIKLRLCGKRTESMIDQCDVLLNLTTSLNYNYCNNVGITLEGLGFNPSNYTITWSDVTGNILQDYNDQHEISVVSSGAYCYKVEAIDDCCSTEGCVDVSQEEMNKTIGIWPQIIYQNCNPEVDVNTIISNLSWPYYFNWENGSTEHFITVTEPGTYCLTVTGNNGCSNTACFEVEDRILKISGTPDLICPNETGTISPIITGGVEPLTFLWSNDETTQDITDLPVGTYYLYVEDANGCWETEEFEIKINDKIVAVSNFKNLQDCTIPDGSITISSLLDEIIIYRWYDSSGNQISTNKDLSGLSPGTYRLVATSENGCTTEISQSICCCNPGLNTGDPGACYIGYNKDLTVTGTVTHTSNGINNGSVILFVQGGKGQYVFNWTGPDEFTSSEEDISNLSQGEYTVTITDGCKVIIKNFIINDSIICQNTNINITDKTTCILQGVAPGKIDITVSGGKPPYSYQWTTDGSTAQDYSSYYGGSSIIVTDQNGCIAKKYYNLPNGNKLLANFLITNPDPCNEYVNDVLATIKIISGNPPYNVRISNNVGFNKVFTFNEEDFSVRVPAYNDGLLWNYVIYYFDVSDGCNFSVNESQTITCDKLCPERCLQVSVTNTGPGGCIDVEENIGLSGASRFKYESFCNDGMKREIYNETKNEGFVFETKASHEGQDLYKFNLAIYDIFLRNYTTGCVIHERIDASDRCWNLWNWFGTLAGGPSSNTSSSNPCPKYKNVVTPKYLPQKSNFHVDVSAEKDQEIEFEVSFNGNYLFSFYQNIGTSNTSIDFDFINQLPGDYIIKVHSPFADCKKEIKFKIENVARPAPINCNNDIINLVFDTTSNYFLSFERSDLSENNKLITNLLSKKLEYNSVIDSTLVINNIKNIEGIYMDKNYNLYNLVHEQIGDFLFEKMDINNNIIWTLPIKFNVYNVSRDSFGNFILIGYDSFNNKWITQSISTDGSLSSQVVVPLYTDQYSNIYHFDNSTIAFDSISNKLIFLTLSNINEIVLPSGLNIKDIKNLENGNILIGAEFKEEMSIGELTYNSSGHNNAIFITFDNIGNILASQSVQNYRDETVEGIATKGNEEVAYHGRYTEIVNYASDPSENVVESCIFVNIVALNDSPCTILPPVLSLDEQSCTLDIEQQQMEVNYILQQKTDSIWSEMSGATFPYTPEINGEYRISASTSNCPSAVSEMVDVNCIRNCHKEALDIIYNDQVEKFQHFYKVGLQTNTINDEWISPATFESLQSFLALQCENIYISYIRMDADRNIYIIGSDPGNIHRTRIIKYHHSTLEVLWSHWIENFRIESVIPYAVGNIIALAGYHPVEKTWYIKGYLLKDGVLTYNNVQNVDKSPDKINVVYDAIYWLGENKYIFKEYNNPSVTYKSPENTWTAPLPPLIVVREFSINHWNQVTVGGEFFGSFTINDVLYESGLFRSLVFITYNNAGQVIHVNVIKSDRHYILKTFANNGYYRYAYTGYVSETAFPDSLLLNTAAVPTLPGVCVATGGFVNENIQSRHVSASFKAIRFYPNPFSKGINLDITSEKEDAVIIETFNTVGTLMFTTKLDIQKGQNVRYIDAFERMPVGVYIVKIKSDDLEHLTRVIRIE